jgi:DNA-binding NtrC family response regulator
MNVNILVIDDNPDVAKALRVLFAINDMDCMCANSRHFDLVVQDMNFSADTTSGEEGMALFHRIREQFLDIPIILITAWTHLEAAVELVKSGAADYLAKPWDDEKLLVTVKNLLELNELQQSNQHRAKQKREQQAKLESKFDLCGIQFRSESMLNLLQMVTQVAAAEVPVLITGPNGAGKEKIAEIIQANSLCKSGPFVKVNVGALSADLLEAELFGAEAGSYTGANKRRIGRFESAHGGTLFLDEIGNLSVDGQAKLLRVLETGEFERIGSNEPQKVKVRIISATNTDLPKAIEAGEFREDLYYRLNLINVDLMPLSQRKEDIAPLIDMVLGDSHQISSSAMHTINSYNWPGNVRELLNTLTRAKLLCRDGVIQSNDLGISLSQNKAPKIDQEMSKEQIEDAIKDAHGVMSDAAKLLGLSRSALYRRLKKHNISVD